MTRKSRFFLIASILAVAGIAAAALSAGDTPALRPTDKAFYADQAMLNFVRPGLVFTITKAEITADGTITAWVKMTDPKGAGLDREGITSPGAIAASFLIGYIPGHNVEYKSYITRSRTGAAGTVTQATGENTGKWTKLAEGEYTYTFLNKVPAGYDKNATHTVGIYGSRNLDEFEMGRQYDDAVFNWVPNGTPVTVVRDIIRTQSCNNCHSALGFHGGSRRTMEICNMCHTPQTPSAGEGVPTNMQVMIHKIHMGRNLPSVIAGGKYVVGGNDYSTVGYPAPMMACKSCHEDQKTAGATQADYWQTKPNRAACGACHDNVNFETGENHAGIPQFTDNLCTTCHQPRGELDFDISVAGAHTVPIESTLLAGVVLKINAVTDVAPGKSPIVDFTITDKKGNPVDIKTLTSLRVYMAGPTTDIPSYVRETPLTATGPGQGRYFWTFAAKLPADATGSWQFGMEGYRTTVVLQGTTEQRSLRDYASNPMFYASAGSGPATPRRTVVTSANCNKCHYVLEFHGSNRNTAQMCTFCHNPNLTEGNPAVSWNYSTMIHRYHGEEVRYPGILSNCAQCHTGNSQNLPLQPGLLPTKNGEAPINPTPPATNACLSCHNETPAWQHAGSNITALGESCSVCHGANSEFSVSKVHAQ
jgi:OmcA/MtrC family decaheme c-type cytochrome